MKNSKVAIVVITIIIVIVVITVVAMGWMFSEKSQAPVQQSIEKQAVPKASPEQKSSPVEVAQQAQQVAANEVPAVTLKSIQEMTGQDSESFNNGPYLYLHGEISKIRSWAKLDVQTKNSLEKLLQNVPITKLDYSKNPNNVSDELLIGPIKNCEQYKVIIGKIAESKLSFPWKLAHGHGDNNDLEKCVDFSEFD